MRTASPVIMRGRPADCAGEAGAAARTILRKHVIGRRCRAGDPAETCHCEERSDEAISVESRIVCAARVAAMPPIDLSQLAARESEQVEWKENVADIDDVVAALCAFANDLANLGGGYVVCGAREARDEHGFPAMVRTGLTAARLKEVEGRVLARCRERVAPSLTPLADELPAETEDRRVLVFTQPATSTAHTFRRDNEGARHYVRVGRSTIEARNSVLLNLLVRKGSVEPWDRRVCPTATERDLDLLVLRDTLNQMRVTIPEGQLEQFLSEETSLSPFIPSLCVRESLTNTLRPRNFAILLFGRTVQRFIPGAFSLFSVYPGLDRSDRHANGMRLPGQSSSKLVSYDSC